MKIEGKVWGQTEEIIKGSSFEVHRIVIKEGGYCSLHKHIHKNNMFYVEAGKIEVEVHKNNYNLIDTTYLSAGDSTIIKPGEYHKFRAMNPSIVYEIYWLDDIAEDIERKSIGGIIE